MSVTGFLINGEKQKYDHRALDNAPIQPGEGDNSFVAVNETDPNEATEYGAVVLGGSSNTASGRNSAALGSNNIASGQSSISFGGKISGFNANESSNNGTIVIGSSSQATMPYAVAIGAKNAATASYAVAMGCQTTASGNLGFTSGYSTTASGAASVAMGRETTASAQYAMSVGYGTNASGASSTVIGQYNVVDTGDTSATHGAGAKNYLMIVGNGAADNDRSNALTLDWDGNLDVAGSVRVNGTPIGSNTFVATYGTTTSAEIEAAFQAGKFIYVEVPSNGRRMYLTVRISATEHRFGSIHYSDGIPAMYAATCVNDSWSGIGRTLVNQNSFATSFGDSQAYAIGDYCIHDGYLYRFTSAHAAGAWSDSHATQVKLVDEVQNKVNANQGTANAGKFLVVGSDGIVTPVTMQAWSGGSY